MNQKYHPSSDMQNYLILLRRVVYGVIRSIYKILPPLKNNLVVLNYHGIGNTSYRFDVTKENFEAQMQYLIMEGYVFISVAQLAQWLNRKSIPNGLFALLTFDDGNKSVLKVHEFLMKHNIRPAIFVLTENEHTDKTILSPEFEHMTDAELLSVQKDGWEIGGHSATHLYLPRVIDDATLDHELNSSKKTLENVLGRKVNYFAYPHGGYNQKVIDKVREAGYTLAFSTDEAMLDVRTNDYCIPRVGINRTHSLTEFKAVITPLSLRLKPFLKRFYE